MIRCHKSNFLSVQLILFFLLIVIGFIGYLFVTGTRSSKLTSLASILVDYTLDGEVFIADNHGKSTKLSLVPVGMVSLDELIPYLNKKAETANTETARLESLIQAAQASPLRVETEHLKKLHDDLEFQRLENFNDRQLKKQTAEAWTAYTNALARWKPIKKQIENLTTELERYYSNEYLLSDGSAPKPTRITKTDSDGKFQIKIPRSGNFALLAIANTPWGEKFWLVKIPNNGGSPRKKIMLTNENISDPENGLILRDL